MGIKRIENDSLIRVESTMKGRYDHHTLIISNANIGYLCSQYPDIGMLAGTSEREFKFHIILNPDGKIPDEIGAASLDKTYTILLSAPIIDSKCSIENIKDVISIYKEIPIKLKFNSMTVGYISLKLQESL